MRCHRAPTVLGSGQSEERDPLPVRTESQLGEPCWIDLETRDPARSIAFYGAFLGWRAVDTGADSGRYTMFFHGDAAVAGLTIQDPSGGNRDFWTTFLASDNVDETVQAANAAGATVFAPPQTIGDQGRLAVLTDPAGAAVGIWEAGFFAGFGADNEIGTPVWHELITRDFPAAIAFYEQVFGWTPIPLSDTTDFRYSTFGHDESMTGGVCNADAMLPEGVPSHWQVYIGVANVRAAAARVPELGGTVLREPWDSDFGTFAQIADATGAAFLLGQVQPEVS
ncbi:VOC family protein [Cryobacterium glaciale]|uniref:VOC family protein n=1 Tax=Cryobacterium glaciale TaxID=1259145 RepID=A0A4R8UVP4_9MICO|nr:VOC family protein [Cryobacterium glaciale]TFB71398.1 VOC family protein [Cryobacterium glaciale]